MIEAIFWTVEEVVAAGEKLYERKIQHLVEIPENLGKMLTLDVETGEYFISVKSADGLIALKAKNPMARLFTLRVGHDVAISFGGSSEKSIVVL
jgi:hypothetical protein